MTSLTSPRSTKPRSPLGSATNRGVVYVLAAVLALLASSCSDPVDPADQLASSTPPDPAPAETTTTVLRVDVVPSVLASMTNEQKVGQLLMPVLSGRDANAVSDAEVAENLAATGLRTPAEIVERYQLGGVIYLPGNIDSAEQVRTLSSDLQRVAESSSGIGLLVAVDQEGGRVNRITDQVTVFPSAEDLAGDIDAVLEASYITGQQLQRQGFNVVLAPVADVVDATERGFIGDRSYGTDPQVVADMVAASISGLQQAGVAAAAKHWPGHGATATDSHQDLPFLDIDRAEWEARERVPFEAAIAENVAIVLVGHLAMPDLDATSDPATVSPVLIEQLLRSEMGYDGVVMTDALNMGAVSGYDEGELVVQAVLAGADIMLVPPDLEAAKSALEEAVASGRIPQEHLDAAVTRVLRLKQDLGVLRSSR